MNLFSEIDRLDTLIRRLFGNVAVHALGDLRVQELSFNNDGRLFADFGAGDMRELATRIDPDAVEAALLALATDAGKSVNLDGPQLDCILANGFRFHGALPPLSPGGPIFSIRTHQRRDWALDDYLQPDQIEQVRGYIKSKKTILIGGATSSGKTSLLSAIISEIPAEERLAILEDETELAVRAGNVIRSKVTPDKSLKDLVKNALRQRPDRIIVGEIRGQEAYYAIDAFATGHQGGMLTIHAAGAAEVMTRLARLVKEGSPSLDGEAAMQLIHEAVEVILFVERLPNGRRIVSEMKEMFMQKAQATQSFQLKEAE